MTAHPLHYLRQGQLVTFQDVAPTRTLLQVLREDLGACGSKEGCNEGDCGACTVVMGELQGEKIKYSSINSCIRFAHSIAGKALWTVEDIAPSAEVLHPAQQAMVDCFGSQCGFCTPGFVMSLFATYQNRVLQGEAVTRELAQEDLSGNLCRCTGYRPILDAAERMASLPKVQMDENRLLSLLKQTNDIKRRDKGQMIYAMPRKLPELLQTRAANPKAQIVAGCTDVGLWVNKMYMEFDQVIDVTQVEELRQVERYPQHIAIGAAVNLNDAFAALVADRPQLKTFASRFAGKPVRNSGTLGGNVVNGSPIGDSMPLLIALNASLVLMRWSGNAAKHREVRVEDFYTGYRKNILQPDEVLAWIKVPLLQTQPQTQPQPLEFLRAYKISKRFEDDISAVCLVIQLTLENGKVKAASIGAGGVAATPVRAVQTEAFLTGKPWNPSTVQAAQTVLRKEFSPISDMRASGSYRQQVLGNLLQRFWLENQGETVLNLEHGLEHALAKPGERAPGEAA